MRSRDIIKLILIFYIISAFVFLVYGSEIIKLDEQLFLQVNQIKNPFLDYFFMIVTLGGSTVFWGLLVLTFWLSKRRKTSIFLLIAFVVDSLTLFSSKLLFNRPRPGETLSNLKILDQEIGKSFPSAHSERAFSGATILSSIHKNLRFLFYGLALLIAISRVYLGVHYPLDIIYGSINGILIGCLIKHLNIEKLKEKLEKIIPF